MPILKTTAANMVAATRDRIEGIETVDLIAMVENPNVVIVDIRDIRERQRTGCIPGSVYAPRGMIEFWVDPESQYFKEVFGQQGKTYAFHCASGWRSALTALTLQDMGFDAVHLKDGFSTRKKQGGPVEMPTPKDEARAGAPPAPGVIRRRNGKRKILIAVGRRSPIPSARD